ncbi:SPOR domain-containing protein [Komagataeibacter saccharivorans]|uniref:SPOR domain-containing protein n=1 Tax=Komagataeibacter saccharivorans TaxID=265959 RepID=UPI0021558CDB|nr:SPOR domain-containing protein [Komagataeibacter saccharivorans]
MSPDDTSSPDTPPDDDRHNPAAPDPYAASKSRMRERMGADSNPDIDPRNPMEPPEGGRSRPGRSGAGMDFRGMLARLGGISLIGHDPTTRKLVYGAAGLGGVLVVAIGGWSLFGHHQGGIPVLGPPPGPVRVKPADPGGMQILGAADGMPADGGVMRLSPPPEQPQPDAMARQYGQNAGPDAAHPADAATAPEATPTPPAPPAGAPPAAPSPAAQEAPEPEAAAPPPSRSVAEAPSPAATLPPPASGEAGEGSGAYGVQLAALDSQAAALKSWNSLSSRYPRHFRGVPASGGEGRTQ